MAGELKHISKKLAAFILTAILAAGFSFSAEGATDLRKNIEEKNRELQAINLQIAEAQSRVNVLTGQSRTLERELLSIDYQVRQLELGIRASEINIEKLELEINELDNQLHFTNDRIEKIKTAIAFLLREIQRKDNEKLLEILLRTGSLGEGLFQFQALNNVQNSLVVETTRLGDLAERIDNNLKDSFDKQNQLRIENANLRNRQAITQDRKNYRRTLLTQTKSQERIFQSELKKLEQRQVEIAQEIEKIEAELRLQIDPTALPAKGTGILMTPAQGPITQKYGRTAFARHAYPSQFHNGIDIGAPIGTPIFSAERGVVVAIGDQDKYCYKGAYGKFIVIRHENNLTTLYAHLSRILVNERERVERGSLIGYIGSTGYSTGPHLHFTVYATSTFYMGPSRSCGLMPFGGHLDPEDYI